MCDESSDDLSGFATLSRVRDKLEHLIGLGVHQRISLLILNIDDFSQINNAMGSKAGDLVLNLLFERLQSICSENDLMMTRHGNEFMLILLNYTHLEVSNKAKKILKTIAKPIVMDTKKIYLTACIGISFWPEDTQKADELLAYSVIALNQTKQLGMNTYHFYSKKNGMQARYVQRIKHNLIHVLDRDELYLCYQPQVDLHTKRVVGCEALLRWKNPELGLVSPCDFISVAEKTGQIIPIGDWVLRTACAQAALWQKAGYVMKLSVNVSLTQLYGGKRSIKNNFVTSVHHILKETGLNPACIELEITESTFMQMNDKKIIDLMALKKLGVCLSCDDFGSGCSSYDRVVQFPLNTIKIDRSLVAHIHNNPQIAQAIICGITVMAHQLKIKIIVEGVETQEQVNLLSTLGCDMIQGNYFSKPVLPEKLELLFKKGFSPEV